MRKGSRPLLYDESVKHIVDAAMDMPEKEALVVEKNQATINIMSGQCIEGISAFLEKRAPKWQP